MDVNQNKERAQQEYLLARKYSKDALSIWEKGGDYFLIFKKQHKRLQHWKSIMSTAPVLALTIAFIPVCIAEYYFSREIYRDINEISPWAIALGFICIGIVISEFLVYKLFSQKREWKMYEMRHQNELNNFETNESINSKVKTYANLMFILGLILASGIIFLLYKFSVFRVDQEVAAGRQNPFGVQDYLPVGLYLFEILTGFFVWYTIRLFYLIIKVYVYKKMLYNAKLKCAELSTMAIKKLEDAEEFGLNLFDEDTKPEKDFCTAAYRNKESVFSDDECFFTEPQILSNTISFIIKNKGNTVPDCKVFIKTEFKYLESKSTNSDGLVTFKFDSFPNDAVIDIELTRIDPTENKPIERVEHGSYALNQNSPIIIDWG